MTAKPSFGSRGSYRDGTIPAKPSTPLAVTPSFYRCPACGEQVDGNDRAAMRLHHWHVLQGGASATKVGPSDEER